MQQAPETGVSTYRTLPAELFKVVGSADDPFYTRPGIKWTLRRLFHPHVHRLYVGDQAGGELDFREACRFQLDFLIAQGLEPGSVFLDLGCGCLRAGLHFIEYLDPGRYLGVDISAEAIYRGITRELGMETFRTKRPEFVVTDSFEFAPLSQKPEFVLANSLFTHLPSEQVRSCLRRLREFVSPVETKFFATFSEAVGAPDHAGANHYHGGTARMTYTQDEMHALGRETGWRTAYIGAWGHPKNAREDYCKHQMMFSFTADG